MAQVNVILLEEVPPLGDAGDLVKVKAGYARNYLIPQGKASVATTSRVKELEHHKRVVAEKVARERSECERERDRLQSLSLEITMRSGEDGKLFGSVTALQIADLIAERGLEVDRRKILLSEPIKQIGEHVVPIRLHRDVVAEVKLNVVAAE
ncbi:MAG: 50S ribosomal protein L9 [Deltaproteobacteria bacterium]|nr:MAG: 50S ribosomal protein L9 [Deltaproteobacteria bacterium]